MTLQDEDQAELASFQRALENSEESHNQADLYTMGQKGFACPLYVKSDSLGYKAWKRGYDEWKKGGRNDR